MRSVKNSMRPGRRLTLAVGTALVAGLAFAIIASGTSLPGSSFEIDNDANLRVDGTFGAASLDWANVAETRKADQPSGATDDSFGNGTKEDTAVPSVVDGSIPPNKSDLLNFGVYLETTSSGARFLNLFWHRVQEPSGTTNMDFEFNQSSTISANGVTPVRTAGDLLIQYDLSQGGTNPVLRLSRWITAGNPATLCQASNSLPCWSTKTNLTAAGDATGSINTSPIPAAQADGLGPISPRTFGEAQIDFDALTGGSDRCTSFGSAYLKSRSSDSFTAALKDFIAPAALNLNNCARVVIRKETTPKEDPNTTEFGFTKNFVTDPATANTFTLMDDGVKDYGQTVRQGANYVVDENVIPTGWDLQNINCDVAGHPSSGVSPAIDVAAGTVTFAIDSTSDVLDCTYRNRARATIVVEKITDDGSGSFEFTSSTLAPSPFTLTTTAAGAGGKDSRTFDELSPAITYDVAETVPAGWNLVSGTCDDGSDPAAIDLSPGELVTCTFHDARQTGAIRIMKLRKHAAEGPGDHPHAGVDFTLTGGELPAAGVTGTTNATWKDLRRWARALQLRGRLQGPRGDAGRLPRRGDKTVTVDTEGSCPSTNVKEVVFHNTPLTNITLSVDSQVDGGTASTIDCGQPNAPASTGPNGDGSVTRNNLEPGTYTCTVVVDP